MAEVDPQSDARLAGLQHGPHAHLWVADDGCGIEPAVRERIFDPFYTTKPPGQGTGLGLAVVQGIVRSHRGAITVDSAPGRGSRFDLYFPLAPADEPQNRPAVATPPRAVPAGRGQQVLYVDDDEVMAVLVERLLQRAGYAATICRTAQQALELLRAQPRRYELVVTDHNMPGLSGLELCRQIAALCPGLPRVISSGHVSTDLRAQALHEGVLCVLHKENTVDELPPLLHALLAPEGTATDP
jgi:CheY-like chemotaxis protein